jgi:hypothetical protein
MASLMCSSGERRKKFGVSVNSCRKKAHHPGRGDAPVPAIRAAEGAVSGVTRLLRPALPSCSLPTAFRARRASWL